MERDNLKANVKYHREFPVDIIIPFHGQYHHLSECLRSLLTVTKGQLFTITVVDDGSPNKGFLAKLEKDRLPKIPIQYLHNETQIGFGASLRRGFDATQNQWVLFMHSDCQVVHTDWLMNMVLCMQEMKKEGVKLISAKVDHGGTGSFDPAIIGTNTHTPNVIVEQPLPLICSLVHRTLFNHIEGFIKPYPYGWYEDEELFWRMKLCGYKQAVCGKAFIHHVGGAVMSELLKNYAVRQKIDENRDTYISDIRDFAKKRKT
jgi:O-antigen biosynthesis protein